MKKYFVLCVILLFIVLAFTPYIKAVDLSNRDLIDINSNKVTSISEETDMGLDIAVLDIVPYIWKEEKGLLGELRLSLEIKNVGDTPTSGWVKYNGNASYWINNGTYGSAWGGLLGVLDPGETWIPKSGAGLLFVNIIPRIFYIEYEVTPIDSNPDNNYIKQVYLVRGGEIFSFCIHIPLLE